MYTSTEFMFTINSIKSNINKQKSLSESPMKIMIFRKSTGLLIYYYTDVHVKNASSTEGQVNYIQISPNYIFHSVSFFRPQPLNIFVLLVVENHSHTSLVYLKYITVNFDFTKIALIQDKSKTVGNMMTATHLREQRETCLFFCFKIDELLFRQLLNQVEKPILAVLYNHQKSRYISYTTEFLYEINHTLLPQNPYLKYKVDGLSLKC